MEAKYSGICIGGPWANQRFASRHPREIVNTVPRVTIQAGFLSMNMIENATITYKTGQYRWNGNNWKWEGEFYDNA